MSVRELFNISVCDLSKILIVDSFGNIITKDYFTDFNTKIGNMYVVDHYLTEFFLLIVVENDN